MDLGVVLPPHPPVLGKFVMFGAGLHQAPETPQKFYLPKRPDMPLPSSSLVLILLLSDGILL